MPNKLNGPNLYTVFFKEFKMKLVQVEDEYIDFEVSGTLHPELVLDIRDGLEELGFDLASDKARMLLQISGHYPLSLIAPDRTLYYIVKDRLREILGNAFLIDRVDIYPERAGGKVFLKLKMIREGFLKLTLWLPIKKSQK